MGDLWVVSALRFRTERHISAHACSVCEQTRARAFATARQQMRYSSFRFVRSFVCQCGLLADCSMTESCTSSQLVTRESSIQLYVRV